jgi:hypothetical protein
VRIAGSNSGEIAGRSGRDIKRKIRHVTRRFGESDTGEDQASRDRDRETNS